MEKITLGVGDVGVPVLLCDAQGVILLCNDEVGALLGTEAVSGGAVFDLAARDGEPNRLQAQWRARAHQGHGWSQEASFRGPDGRDLSLHLVILPVMAAERGVGTWLVVLQDFTETRLHQRQLELYARELSQLFQANQRNLLRLEEAERSRDHFYSLVSHELKTPLTSLKAALEILQAPGLIPAEAKEVWQMMKSMQRSTLRLERMFNDLLDVASAKRGELFLDFAPVDLVEVIQTVLDEMAPVIKEKGIALTWRARPRKGLVVRGDHVRLQQVVQNLLSNALKAAPAAGAVRITATRDTRDVRVEVENPGVVLDPSIKETLFQPFVKSPARGYKTGAGLGLSVVDSLVKAHGGSIVAEQGAQGVVFRFTVPAWQEGSQA